MWQRRCLVLKREERPHREGDIGSRRRSESCRRVGNTGEPSQNLREGCVPRVLEKQQEASVAEVR